MISIRRRNRSYGRWEWGYWYIGRFGKPLWKHVKFEPDDWR